MQFLAGATPEEKDAALASVGGNVRDLLRPGDASAGDLVLVDIGNLPEDRALSLLNAAQGVRYAEADQTLGVQAVSNDAYYTNGSLWGMYGDRTAIANAYGSQAGEAWAEGYTGSSKIVVGDVDTGIDYTHPDLYLNVWLNQGELPAGMALRDTNGDGLITFIDLNNALNASYVSDLNGNGRIDAGDLLRDPRWANGVDNDGNGYVDDLVGWDFVNNDNDPYDDNSHGTHTAGTIGATGGNGVGVVGVNWNVEIMPLKFLAANGSGSLSGAVSALNYYTNAAILDRQRGWSSEFVATNNSWGGGGYYTALLDAISRGARNDILFVAAAGNSAYNNDVTTNYPSNYSTVGTAGYESVIAVAALTSSGALAYFSNYGATTVDLGAPGAGIWSTVPGGYASYSGTSMATPHVTGALALYAAQHPNLSASQLREALLGSTAMTPALAGKTVTGGRLDVEALMASGAAAIPIETAGNTALVTVGDYYGLYAKDAAGNPTTGPFLKYGNMRIAVSQLAAWIPVGAEASGSGYKVLFKNTANQFLAWNTDQNGAYAYTDPAGVVDANGPGLWGYETLFGQNFNGDAYLGAPPATPVETVGNTALVNAGSYYGLYAKDGAGNPTTGPFLRYDNTPIAVSPSAPWIPVGAETSGAGYKVLFRNAANQFLAWNTDQNGVYAYTDPAGVVDANGPAVWGYETFFGQNFNGDAYLGAPPATPVETVGNTALVNAGNYYGLYAKDGAGNPTTGPFLRYDNTPIAVSPSAPWIPVGAEASGAGYKVLFRNAANQFLAWNTDQNGVYAYADPVDVVDANGPALWGYETLLGQNFNGDAYLGPPPATAIETAGNTALVNAGNYYGLYAKDVSGNPTSGQFLKYDNMPIAVSQSVPWIPVGAEASGAGYKVLFKNADNLFFAWNTDETGNFAFSDAVGVVAADSAALLGYEVFFNQNFNGDSAIGPAQTTRLLSPGASNWF